MDKNKLIQYGSIAVVIISVVVSGYIILKPSNSVGNTANGLAPMVDGKQVIKMDVMAVSYNPNSFTVKVGVPVRWEITSSGQPGCASGELIANGLTDPIYLNPQQGQITVKEFTPQTSGTYRFSCPMGMARGSIEVVN